MPEENVKNKYTKPIVIIAIVLLATIGITSYFWYDKLQEDKRHLLADRAPVKDERQPEHRMAYYSGCRAVFAVNDHAGTITLFFDVPHDREIVSIPPGSEFYNVAADIKWVGRTVCVSGTEESYDHGTLSGIEIMNRGQIGIR
jgi:hypothetical protein